MEELARPGDRHLSRRGLLKSSLVVGLGATGLAAASTALTGGVARATNAAAYALTDKDITVAFTVQTAWRYCVKCRNIYYSPEGGEYCAAGGTHTTTSQTIYEIPDEAPDYNVASGSSSLLQEPWRWCKNCSCLFWGNGESSSWCAAMPKTGNQNHDGSSSGVYYMLYDSWTGITSLQPNWRYCYNCKDLYFGGDWSSSVCYFQLASGEGINNNNGMNGEGHAPGDTVYYAFT